MSFSNFLENTVLNLVFGGTAFSPSGNLYLGFSTTTPAEDGTNFTEPSPTGGYQRAIVGNNKSAATGWTTASQLGTSGELRNNGVITFGVASGGWGTLTHYGLFDQPGNGSGNMYTMAAISGGSVTVAPNTTLSVASGQLSIRID